MFWKVRATPRSAILRGAVWVMSWPLQRDPAGVRMVEAADHVEQGRLSRPVGTDDRDQLTGADRERHRLDRPHAAKMLRTRPRW